MNSSNYINGTTGASVVKAQGLESYISVIFKEDGLILTRFDTPLQDTLEFLRDHLSEEWIVNFLLQLETIGELDCPF